MNFSAVMLMAICAASWCCQSKAADDAVFAHPLEVEALEGLVGPAIRTLANRTGLRGQFEQRRYLSDLPQPLISTGDFLFARDLGVCWHTATPFDSAFVLTPSGIVTRDENGHEVRISSAAQPGIAMIVRLFSALFGLDFRALSADFVLFGRPMTSSATSAPGATWEVGLRPRQAALQAILMQALVEGGDAVLRIEIADAHGDRTEIRLLRNDLISGSLSVDDRARFAPTTAIAKP